MDDLVILVKSRRAGRRVMAKISRYLSLKLKLKVNRQKSRMVKIEDLEYLGVTFRGIRIFASHQAMQDFKHRLRGLISRSWEVSMAERIERLNRYLNVSHAYGMSNEWLEQQGLLSIKQLWLKVQGYA